jgi:hypothetical protein
MSRQRPGTCPLLIEDLDEPLDVDQFLAVSTGGFCHHAECTRLGRCREEEPELRSLPSSFASAGDF